MERPITRRNPRPFVDTSWHESAACAGEDVGLFFTGEGEQAPERELREMFALAVCSSCPVMAECREYALGRPDRHGIRGGMTPAQLDAEHRRRTRRAAEARRRGAAA